MKGKVLFLLIFITFFGSCTHTNRTQEFVKKSQTQLPIPMGDLMDLTSIFIDGKNVVITCLIDDRNTDYNNIFNSPYPKMSIEYSLREKGLYNMCKTFIEDGYGLTFRYKGRKSGKNLDANFSVLELKQIQQKGLLTEIETNEYRLKLLVENHNRQLPITIDELITIKKFILVQNLIIEYEVKENEELRLPDYSYEISKFKNTYFQDLQEEKDIATTSLLSFTIGAHKGFTIRYVGSETNANIDINYTYSELKDNYNRYLSSLLPLDKLK